MSEKLLDENEWKRFAKGGDYKDAALLKALAALAKAAPAERESALAEVDRQGELLLKAHKGDKKLAEHWKAVSAALTRERKAAEVAAAEAAGDDEAGPAVLTTKMVPLLRAVPKGEALQALVAYVGDQTAVLVSRKAIGAPQRKLLAGQLGVTGGIKYLGGQCIWEKDLHTFVLESLVAGMAKKLKAALFGQTEIRWKIRVRGLDPNVVEEDLDDGDGAAAVAGAAGAAAAQADPADAARAAYEARLEGLQAALKTALANPKQDGSKLRALLAFAQGKADGGQYAAALQGLDALARQLGVATAPPETADATVDPSKAFNARLGALLPAVKEAPESIARQVKARIADAGNAARDKDYVAAQGLLDEVESALEAAAERARAALDEWQSARAAAIDDIEEVIEAVRETGDPDARAVEIQLRSIIANLTEAPDTPQAVAELRRWLETDDVITAAEEVPAHYGSLDLRAPLLVALQALAAVRG